jgi:RNA polymerase-binding transcription factor DksA
LQNEFPAEPNGRELTSNLIKQAAGNEMTKRELETYRQRLLDLGKGLQSKVSDLGREALRKAGGEESGNLSNTPVHLADLASDNFEQEVTISLLETEEQRLEEIAAALERIQTGVFGRCEECQQEISEERLRAIPYTRLCIDCANREEDQTATAGVPGNL